MPWDQFFVMFLSMLGMFIATFALIISFSREITKEMKDFHGRLCVLEEKYIQMMERIMEERRGK